MTENTKQPWQQQLSEPKRSFSMFCIYRDMPAKERTLALAAVKAGRLPRSLDRQSAKWHWVERAEAWDQEQDQVKREAHLEAIVAMSLRHAGAAKDVLTTMMKPVEAMLQKMKLTPELIDNLAKLKAEELLVLINKVAQALPQVTNVERLSRGLPTEIKRDHTLEGMYINVADADSLSATIQILIKAGVVRMGAPGPAATEVESIHSAQSDPKTAGLLTAGHP